jgi:hypothetical protein
VRTQSQQSGDMINYTTLKNLGLANPSLLQNLVTALLQYGLHYYKRKHAICVVIPKQGKSDYTLAKSYRPISLLSCLGKIIEKIVASRIASLGKICGAISSIQFGNKEGHSAHDALLRTHEYNPISKASYCMGQQCTNAALARSSRLTGGI